MKPFDLEAAKRGEPIVDIDGDEVNFIGIRMDGRIVCEWPKGGVFSEDIGRLFMAPKKRTVWVNLFNGGAAFHYDTKEEADRHEKHFRINKKAYPVEIEE